MLFVVTGAVLSCCDRGQCCLIVTGGSVVLLLTGGSVVLL